MANTLTQTIDLSTVSSKTDFIPYIPNAAQGTLHCQKVSYSGAYETIQSTSSVGTTFWNLIAVGSSFEVKVYIDGNLVNNGSGYTYYCNNNECITFCFSYTTSYKVDVKVSGTGTTMQAIYSEWNV